MSRALLWGGLVLACLSVAVVQGQVTTPTTPTSTDPDALFVLQASAAGLGEVNLGYVGVKQATNPDVKKFAQDMVKDHNKANAELIDLANRKKWSVAPRMDAEHQAEETKLLRLSGSDFDREFMAAMVKDHNTAVALFERQGKEGKDPDLKKWAEKTLPTLREHQKQANDINNKLKGGGDKTDTGKTKEKDKSS
jgi:putative membrane protein